MGLIIGMDEAGYGPNIGPLVVTATVWRVPGNPRHADLWEWLSDVVSQTSTQNSDRIHVADSKQVYSTARGLSPLERSIQTLLGLSSLRSDSFRNLCEALTARDDDSQPDNGTVAGNGRVADNGRAAGNGTVAGNGNGPENTSRNGNGSECELDGEPWFAGRDLKLPAACQPDEVTSLRERLQEACRQSEVELAGVRSDIVLTKRFNGMTSRLNSKGATLTRLTLDLLRSVWDPESDEAVQIVGDKHGGRNRYDGLLEPHLDGQMIFRVTEGRKMSSYRIGRSEIHFQQAAEEHFPVAVSSMVCKYVRELAMQLFNQFWREHLPELRPTKGYPTDAMRFRRDIEEVQQQLGIPDSAFWRTR